VLLECEVLWGWIAEMAGPFSLAYDQLPPFPSTHSPSLSIIIGCQHNTTSGLNCSESHDLCNTASFEETPVTRWYENASSDFVTLVNNLPTGVWYCTTCDSAITSRLLMLLLLNSLFFYKVSETLTKAGECKVELRNWEFCRWRPEYIGCHLLIFVS
jgi:hypothetical protein